MGSKHKLHGLPKNKKSLMGGFKYVLFFLAISPFSFLLSTLHSWYLKSQQSSGQWEETSGMEVMANHSRVGRWGVSYHIWQVFFLTSSWRKWIFNFSVLHYDFLNYRSSPLNYSLSPFIYWCSVGCIYLNKNIYSKLYNLRWYYLGCKL